MISSPSKQMIRNYPLDLSEAGLRADDVDEPGRAFFSFADDDHTTGFGGGLELSARFLLTRSIVIVPDARSSGLAGDRQCELF